LKAKSAKWKNSVKTSRWSNLFFGTLRRRLVTSVAVVHAVLMTFFIVDLTLKQSAFLVERQASQAQALADSLATSSAGWLAAQDVSGLQELVNAQRQYPEMLFSMLLDHHGKVLAHTDASRLRQYVTDLPAGVSQPLVRQSSEWVDVCVPVLLSGVHVGWARVGLSQQAAGRQQFFIIRNGVLYAAGAILIGSVLALLLGGHFTRRMKTIQSVMNDVRAGCIRARVDLPGMDEASLLAAGFNNMQETLERKDRELKDSMLRWQYAVEYAGDGLWDWNLISNEVFFSSRWKSILGYTEAEIKNTLAEWEIRAHPDDLSGCRREIQRHLEGEAPFYQIEHRLRCKDGTYKWILARGKIIEWDEQGRPQRIIGTHTDISERKRNEDALKEAARRKDEFLAMLGHELRNPLAPIRNANQVLKMTAGITPQARLSCEMIERQLLHLGRIVDDLLNVSRIAKGKITLQKEPLDWAGLIRVTTEDFRCEIETQGILLMLDLPDHPVRVLGDSVRLAQIVTNLLNNARKFTDSGGRIQLQLRELPESKTAEFSITDSGIGMTPETLDRIFEPFAQGETDVSRSRGGLGLGLTLVKGWLSLHGGEIQAFSEGLGKGSKFVLRLPLTEEAAKPAKSGTNTEAARMHRVLIIEDNMDAADSLRMYLELLGQRVHVAEDGETGVREARIFKPDVLLCDIGLPGGMDGYAVARTLRSDGDLKNIFMAAMTGYGQEDDKRKAREAGFDRHITKPADPDEIRKLLAEVPARA
jgi:PAS domain S-box-containing protein